MELRPCLWTLCDGEKGAGPCVRPRRRGHRERFGLRPREPRAEGARGLLELRPIGGRQVHPDRSSTQHADGTIKQSFQKAAKKVTMLEVWQKPSDGKLEDELPPADKTACRAAIGGLEYLASQRMGFIAAANVSAGLGADDRRGG
eukprot:8544545-Pyramimonas_sp.AAC.1